MSRTLLTVAASILLPSMAFAQTATPAAATPGPYKVLKTVKVGGVGGYDYVMADSEARRLYVARSGAGASLHVYDLDTLQQVGEVPNVSAHGAAFDDKYDHAFATSKPVTMFDTKTFAVIKKIDVQGSPDGSLSDPYEHHAYILSHQAPHITVIDTKDGSIVSTIDIGGGPEEAVLDGHGKMFVDLEDEGAIAVVDTKAMKLLTTYSLAKQGGGTGCTGLTYDPTNKLLFAACRDKKLMIVVNAETGKVVKTFPNGTGTDGVAFSPKTGEVFSSQGDGTLNIYKATSPTSIEAVQTVATPTRARTLTVDEKTGNVFLITAEFAAAAAAPGATGPAPRPQMVPGTFEIVVVGK